jgi:hypothetical protein
MAMVRPDLRGNPLCALAIVSRFEGRNLARRLACMRLSRSRELLGMEAGQQEHRNKDKCRGDERKVKCLGYHTSENKVFGHDRLLDSYRL